jgi:hypothetical protein
MYIRFVVGTDSEYHRSLTGVITEAQLLIDRGELEEYEINLLEQWEIAAILKEHNVPVRVHKSRMPGRAYYEDEFQIVVMEKKRI